MLTVLLDGTVPMDQVAFLLDVSFELTASKHTKKAGRKPAGGIL